jgi:hypothetical protein
VLAPEESVPMEFPNKDFLKNLEFIVPMNHLEQRLKKLKRYTSFQEKEALLMDDDVPDIDIYNVLQPDFPPLNDTELMYFLLYLRSESVSDLIEGIKECSNCSSVNPFTKELSDYFGFQDKESELHTEIPIGCFTKVEDIINTLDADNLLLMDYNYLQKIIQENNNVLVALNQSLTCVKCGHQIELGVLPRDIISKKTLSNLYQEYFQMALHLHYSKTDIDLMYPFERELFFNLLKREVEKTPT